MKSRTWKVRLRKLESTHTHTSVPMTVQQAQHFTLKTKVDVSTNIWKVDKNVSRHPDIQVTTMCIMIMNSVLCGKDLFYIFVCIYFVIKIFIRAVSISWCLSFTMKKFTPKIAQILKSFHLFFQYQFHQYSGLR